MIIRSSWIRLKNYGATIKYKKIWEKLRNLRKSCRHKQSINGIHKQPPSIETHLAVVRGLPTKTFLPECVNEKSKTERRS